MKSLNFWQSSKKTPMDVLLSCRRPQTAVVLTTQVRLTRYLSSVLTANRFLRNSATEPNDNKALEVREALVFAIHTG